ncbi:MAG: diaminopimelate epimerase [Erysipelotrichia bacterium]|nr:diaminopimelate epimerase [Candidatus Riflebacteria bacterium]NCB38113.1 diaminopimelate epimerase [Erysipelotrichia bacterium]
MIGFSKLHGLGNSFIFFDEINQDFSFIKKADKIKLLCSQGKGLGSDGLVFLLAPRDPKHHCRMEMFNTDGTEAEMCGNAIRGVAHLFGARQLGISPVLIETKGGLKEVAPVSQSEGEAFYKVRMGQALFDLISTDELAPLDKQKIMTWNDTTFNPVYVNVGNPHAVIFLKSPMSADSMKTVGAWLETHPNHPRRINIEFVEIINRNEARINIWERGCGITQACGTGATAVAAAGINQGFFDRKVTIHMPGGDLVIEQGNDKTMYMTGPIQEVAVGQISAGMAYRLSKI